MRIATWIRLLSSFYLAVCWLGIAAKGQAQASLNALSRAEKMPLSAPLFVQNDDIDSFLTVVNGTNGPAEGFVSIRDATGTLVLRQQRTYSGHTSTALHIQELLESVHSHIKVGSVVVEQKDYRAPTLVAQLSMVTHSGKTPAYVEEELGMPTMHGSQSLRAIAPAALNPPVISIVSMSETSQSVHLSCLGEPKSKPVELGPHQAVILRACSWGKISDDLFLKDPAKDTFSRVSSDYAIEAETDAVPGSFFAYGLSVVKSKSGPRLSDVTFSDPGLAYSTQSAFVGVPTGKTSLSEDTTFMPVLSVANFSADPREISVSLAASTAGGVSLRHIASFSLPAAKARTVELPEEGISGLQNTFLIETGGLPGDVVSKLGSRRNDTGEIVQLLAKDARDDHNGGNHPWFVNDSGRSDLILYNPLDSTNKFTVRVGASSYTWNKTYYLQPKETLEISLRDLVEEHKGQLSTTEAGKIPQSGEVFWFTDNRRPGLGRMLETSLGSSKARSYSCPTYPKVCGLQLTPDSFNDGLPGDDFSFQTLQGIICQEYDPNSCYQQNSSSATAEVNAEWDGGNNPYTHVNLQNDLIYSLHYDNPGNFSFSARGTKDNCSVGPVYGGGEVLTPNAACPTSMSLTSTTQLSLAGHTPKYQTGVGLVAQLTAQPSSTDFTNSRVYEYVTLVPGSYTCPANRGDPCQLASNFIIGQNYSNEFFTPPPSQNTVYDYQLETAGYSALGPGDPDSCSFTCNQVLSCGSSSPDAPKIGEFNITFLLTKGTINGYPVTNVTATEH